MVYGVNTGFGGNARYVIPSEELAHHQQNLLEFLSCGVGEALPEEAVRAAILLRANALARGFSAVRLVVIERLLDLLNHRITPVVPRFGSVGASGDLCPSAYIARVMAGRGEAMYKGCRVPAAEALHSEGIPRLELEAKEGLALLNGTTVMTGVGAIVVDEAAYLFQLSLGALAMAAEALGSSPDYYHPAIHMAKHHPGQLPCAEMLNSLLFDSKLAVPLDEIRAPRAGSQPAGQRQPMEAMASRRPTSPFKALTRCAARRKGWGRCRKRWSSAGLVIEREANSVNDNPLVDPGADRVYHTGNFYGAHIARAMDGLKLDLANLANWLHSLMALLMDDRFSNGLAAVTEPACGLVSGLQGHADRTHQSGHRDPALVRAQPDSYSTDRAVQSGYCEPRHARGTDRHGCDRACCAARWPSRCSRLRRRSTCGTARTLGAGTGPIYRAIREVSAFVDADRALDHDIAALSGLIERREIPVLNG